MNTTTDSLSLTEAKTIGKTYRPPQLIEYGKFQQLTKAIGSMGNLDGATTGSMKSQN